MNKLTNLTTSKCSDKTQTEQHVVHVDLHPSVLSSTSASLPPVPEISSRPVQVGNQNNRHVGLPKTEEIERTRLTYLRWQAGFHGKKGASFFGWLT